jgi:hypothetical protein
MRYHQSTTAFNCGIDLHARSMYVCVVNRQGGALADVALSKLGLELGWTGVLHTWTRQLIYHPHVHYLVAGGGRDGVVRRR